MPLGTEMIFERNGFTRGALMFLQRNTFAWFPTAGTDFALQEFSEQMQNRIFTAAFDARDASRGKGLTQHKPDCNLVSIFGDRHFVRQATGLHFVDINLCCSPAEEKTKKTFALVSEMGVMFTNWTLTSWGTILYEAILQSRGKVRPRHGAAKVVAWDGSVPRGESVSTCTSTPATLWYINSYRCFFRKMTLPAPVYLSQYTSICLCGTCVKESDMCLHLCTCTKTPASIKCTLYTSIYIVHGNLIL